MRVGWRHSIRDPMAHAMKHSQRQTAAIKMAEQGDGRLIRYKGGLWSTVNAQRSEDGLPLRYVRWLTIESLVTANIFIVTKRHAGEHGFATEVTLQQGRLFK